jgi:hypothetical protein
MRRQQRIALVDRDQAATDRGGDEGGSTQKGSVPECARAADGDDLAGLGQAIDGPPEWFPACRASLVRHRFARPQA